MARKSSNRSTSAKANRAGGKPEAARKKATKKPRTNKISKKPARKPRSEAKRKRAPRTGRQPLESSLSQAAQTTEISADRSRVLKASARLSGWPRRLLLALVGVLGIAVLGLLGLHLYGRSTLMPETGRITVEGLRAPVRIMRDDLGVPVIEAESDADLFFATGYAMAGDRLWQMMSMRLAASGRLAELLGPEALEADVYLRTIGLSRYARKAYQSLSPRAHAVLQNFSRGINAYVKNNRLPLEFAIAGYEPDEWQPEDSMLLFALANYDLSMNAPEELAFLKLAGRLGLENAAYLVPIYPDQPLPFEEAQKLAGLNLSELEQTSSALLDARASVLSFLAPARHRNDSDSIPASNNWAIAPERTVNGHSLLANDTHLAFGIPGFWMIMHLKSPGYDAAGVMIPGIPIVLLGTNGTIAWGATMVMADSQDIFLERLRTRDDGTIEYEYRGRWIPTLEMNEEFRIKGESETVQRTLRFTHHGPLLNYSTSRQRTIPRLQPLPYRSRYGLAHRWSFADGERAADAVFELGRSRSMGAARTAMAGIDSMYLNLVYADAAHIGWQTTGRVPRRMRGTGQLPSPGWDGRYEWRLPYLPFAEQPHSIDPARGFVLTANNRTVPANARIQMSHSWTPGARAARVRELLLSRDRVDRTFVQEMQFDRVSLIARSIAERLTSDAMRATLSGGSSEQDREALSAALSLLEGFTGQMDGSIPAAALMGLFYQHFTRLTFFDDPIFQEDEMQAAFFAAQGGYGAAVDHLLVRQTSPFFDDVTTAERVENKTDIVRAALLTAYRECLDRWGPNAASYDWGALHPYEYKHTFGRSVLALLFNRGPYSGGGDRHTINAAGFSWGQDFRMTFVPAMRLVVDFSEPDPATLIIPAGQSGNAFSPHYDDMIPLFLSGRSHRLPFSDTSIDQQYDRVLVLSPPSGLE